MSDRQQQFIQETLRLVGQSVGSSRLAFYSVDDDCNLYNFVCRQVPTEFHRLYLRGMHAKDPLHMRHLSVRPEPVLWLDEAANGVTVDDLDEYRDFIARFDTVDTAEMVFRNDGRITAGISIMWTSSDAGPPPEYDRLAHDLQRYIEFNLPFVFTPARVVPGRTARSLFHFTPREAEVAHLLCCGRTNSDIAMCLGIGLATVKTHLIHIFEKTGAETRSGLVARLSAID